MVISFLADVQLTGLCSIDICNLQLALQLTVNNCFLSCSLRNNAGHPKSSA